MPAFRHQDERKLSPGALLSLLQWSDTLFPSGAFSHSFGLESAVDEKKVQNGSDLSAWIRAKLIHQCFPCDLVVIGQAYRAGQNEDFDALQKIAESAYAMRLPREIREAGSMIASRLIQTAAELYHCDWTTLCQNGLSSGELKGDPAVAFAIVSIGAKIPLPYAFFSYLYMFIAGQVSASLRLLPIGQQEGQFIIHRLLSWVEICEKKGMVINDTTCEPHTFMPASEIASMQHETSQVRLFQS